MADISNLSQLVSGIQRTVDISANTLVMSSMKLGTSELTKTQLDLLILTTDSPSAVDASAQHHHDGRYYTESELGDATATSGSDLIGDDNTYSNFTPAAATIKGALSGIDSALATAGSNEFSDSVFRIQDNGDASKQLAFEVSAITTATTRTITVGDEDINLSSGTSGTFADRFLTNNGQMSIVNNSTLQPGWASNIPALVLDGTTTEAQNAFATGIIAEGDDSLMNLIVSTQGFTSGALNTASMQIFSGYIGGTATGSSGDVFVFSGDTNGSTGPGGNSGQVYMRSGVADGNSGNATFGSSNGGTGTGYAYVETGTATTGNSGDVRLSVGNATAGNSGNILLTIGTAGTTQGVFKFLRSGDAPTIGDIWTASATDGTGYWATPSFADSADVADLVTLSGVAVNSTDLGTFTGTTIPDSQTIKQALQALETKAEANTSLLAGWEWQDSVIDYITDNTAAPPSEISGNRYVLSHDGGAPNAAWDGASAGDIVEFNGTTWDATTPTTGMIISVDDETTSLRQWTGSAWSQKYFESTTASTGLTKVGFDIQLADAAAANGIAVSSGAISAQLATGGGLKFITNEIAVEPADFAGTGLEDDGSDNLRLAAQGNGIAGGAGSTLSVDPATEVAGSRAAVYVGADGVGIDLDDSTLTHTSSTLSVKDDGITGAKLAPAVAGDGLKQDGSGNLNVEPADFAGSGLEDDGADNLRIATGAYDGTTITGGGGSAAAVQHAPQLLNTETAGEAMGTGLKAVRYGNSTLDTPETAGRVYLADPTELSLVKSGGNQDPFYVIGCYVAASETAASAVDIVKGGLLTATAHGLTIGQPFYLDASGAVTSTAPTTAGEAIVKLGTVKDANTVDIQIQIMGVN